MKKIISILIIISITYSCTIDDICTEETTPSLVLRFYNATSTQSLKNVDSLYVWAVGATDSLLTNVTTDSIVLPLNATSNTTAYNLSNKNRINKLTINYTTEDVFVSRSCGFKIIFNNVTIQLDTLSEKWISNIVINTPSSTINTQAVAYANVFH